MRNLELIKSISTVASLSLSVALTMQSANAATITVFDGNVNPNAKTNWINALGSQPFQTEDFNSATFNPGISVSLTGNHTLAPTVPSCPTACVILPPASDPESGATEVWRDNINPGGTTTWQFSGSQFPEGIFAWGGDWDLNRPGGPGTGIRTTVQLLMDGQQVVGSEIPNTIQDKFWGIVSDTPFNQVILSSGSIPNVAENYTLDNMVYAQSVSAQPVPESSSALGVLLSAFGAGIVLKRQQQQKVKAKA